MKRVMVLVSLAFLLPAPLPASEPVVPAEEPLVTADVPRPVISEIVSEDQSTERGFAGVVQGENVVTLAFQTSGRLATLNVDVGDVVARGDVLATLDGITLEEDLAASRAALSAAAAEARLGRQQFDRTTRLVELGVATTAALEQARAYRDATAASLRSAEAQLSQAEDAAAYGTLLAPREGIILSTQAEPGPLVSPGTAILELVDVLGREAVIDVPTEYVTLLPRRAIFDVRHHSASVTPVKAVLRLVEPVADANLDTRRLRLTLQDPPDDFRIGSLVTATYATETAPVISLPAGAIGGTEDAPGVWRVGPGRAVEFVPVELGPEVGRRVVITSGVGDGDEIVVRGASSLEEGQIVGEHRE